MSEGIEPTNTAEKVKRLPKRLRPKPPKKPRQKAPKVVRACVLTPNFDADKAKVLLVNYRQIKPLSQTRIIRSKIEISLSVLRNTHNGITTQAISFSV
jgi:hypothetical protein